MKNVDNSIRVRNPEQERPQKVTNKQTNSRKWKKNIYKISQVCTRSGTLEESQLGKENNDVICCFLTMDTIIRVSNYLSLKNIAD